MTDAEIDAISANQVTYGDEKVDAFRKGFRAAEARQPVTLTVEREAFEKWYAALRTNTPHLFRRVISDERYESMETEYAYQAWQARALLSAASQPSEAEPDLRDIENKIVQYGLCKWRGDPRGQSAYLRKEIMDAIRALRQQAPAVQDERAKFEASVIARKSSEIGRALSEKEVAYVLKRYASWNCHLTKEAPYESPCLEAEWKGWEARAAYRLAPVQTGEKK